VLGSTLCRPTQIPSSSLAVSCPGMLMLGCCSLDWKRQIQTVRPSLLLSRRLSRKLAFQKCGGQNVSFSTPRDRPRTWGLFANRVMARQELKCSRMELWSQR